MTTPEYDALISSLASKMAHAIALAEGYFVEGSLPQRINNPGDMKLGDRGSGVLEGKTVYVSADDGWAALQRECTAIMIGASHVYSVNDTILGIALKWTGGDNPGAWSKIVAENLNIDPLTTIAEWVKANSPTGPTGVSA